MYQRIIYAVAATFLGLAFLTPPAHADSHDTLTVQSLPTICANNGLDSVARVQIIGGQGTFTTHTVDQPDNYNAPPVYADATRAVTDADDSVILRFRLAPGHHKYIRVQAGDFTLLQGVKFSRDCGGRPVR